MPRNPIHKALPALVLSAFASAAVAQPVQDIGPVEVETAEFGQNTFDIGSLTPSTGALQSTLWRGTQAEDIAFLLQAVPTVYSNPAELDLLRRVLLSAGPGPDGADTDLTVIKLRTLADAGFYEEAASLAELSGGLSRQPKLAQAVAYADMLNGDLATACRRGANLQAGRSEPFWLKLRLLCYLENGETAAADLSLGLLREQDALEGGEGQLFTALINGATPQSFPAPETGFDYVAARQLGASFTAGQLEGASGIILRAIANDPQASLEARTYAIREGLYMGVLRPSDARSLVQTLQLSPEQIATAREALETLPDDPLTPLLVWRAAAEMTAPEFTIDRSALIGDALQAAQTPEEFTVLAKLFAPMADQVEVVVNYTPYAMDYALAGIVARNESLIRKWTGALTADQSNPDGLDQAAMLLSLLNLRDPALATSLAGQNGITIEPIETSWSTDQTIARELLPDLVRVSLNNARGEAEGAAALSWLILAHTEDGDGLLGSIRETLLADAEEILVTVDIEGELAFEAALGQVITAIAAARPLYENGPAIVPEEANGAPASGPQSRIMPRVKPDGDE
ncbi:hypothetical protein [Aquisalinus flavus]|uniref:Uncharacterized protein n=1 Tax=Aquisalinus flavus TaxID=1526572 RepID=A0A8J2V4X0_9PROT|nr:hypothetical protein [Aquisalinus flavus]MBD0427928.1 hypothetical protein [Aquisalinus flavus]UNE47685.1 hypothetical protein FF099_06285 [Aquisalinus flavus]GGD05023.1 hypothetical protein GCM10011342_12450 [Aquisalinus flavus]